MPFMSKEKMLAEATRLGVDLNGLSWPEQQKKVFAALENESLAKPAEVRDINNVKTPSEVKYKFQGKTIIDPEIRALRYGLVKYDEELGEELILEDKMVGSMDLNGRDSASGSYIIKGKTGRKVVATSSVPQINARITFDPTKDIVPVATYDGRSGYLWNHPTFPCIKRLLMKSGYYEKYKKMFDSSVFPNNIWYAAGKLPVCSISVVNEIFKEIQGEFNNAK